MLGKEVTLYLKGGLKESIICTDFKIGVDGGVSVMMLQVGPRRLYCVAIEKIDHYDVKFVWIFTEGQRPPNSPLV